MRGEAEDRLPFRAGMKRAHREPGRHTPMCVTNQIKSNQIEGMGDTACVLRP
jgi:hypothetical protein